MPTQAKRNRSQALNKKEESKDGMPLKNSQARRQSGVRRESRGTARNAQGPRPPMIPSGKVMTLDKENIRENAKKDYGKVPKYLQKFNK